MMRVIIVHFASLMYYTAIILDLAELKIPKKITFTGMGSKYIKLITDDEATLSLIVSRIFAYYGKLVDNNDLRAANIQIQFSEEPKLVTAQGGLIMESKPLKDSRQLPVPRIYKRGIWHYSYIRTNVIYEERHP